MNLNDEVLRRLFLETKTIAVVGCSRNPKKAAYIVPKFMQDQGYTIIPINPRVKSLLGEKAYPTINDVPNNLNIDIINIFRPEHELSSIVHEAVKREPKVIWIQLGLYNEEARDIARKAGIPIVMDECIMLEYQRVMTP